MTYAQVTDKKYGMDKFLKEKIDLMVNRSTNQKFDNLLVMDGEEGCQPAGEKVLMSDGSWKKIEDIKEGDKVISPQKDGTQKFSRVLKTFEWHCDEVYSVRELNKNREKLYSCSYNHLIPLNVRKYPRNNGRRDKKDSYWTVENKEARDLSQRSYHFKKDTTTLLSPAIEKFEGRENCDIEPYSLGIFIGDGSFPDNLEITTGDSEVMKEVKKHYPIMSCLELKDSKGIRYNFSKESNFYRLLEKEGYKGRKSAEKFIPKSALLSDIDYRKKLLAGLIDSDGYCDKNNNFSITTKSEQLSKDIYNLVRSLGLRGNIREIEKGIKESGFKGKYYDVSFYLNDLILPNKVKRKSNHKGSFYLSSNRVSIDIEKDKPKKVYGFILDSESRWYITEDYVVTHNTGKSTLATQICYYYAYNTGREFNENQVFFNVENMMDFATKNEKKVILWDEAALGGLSDQYQSQIQRKLLQLVMVARKKQHFWVFCIPKFFKIREYIILDRAVALIHTYARKQTQLGYFLYYTKGQKEKLFYQFMKNKTRQYFNYASFRGNFPNVLGELIDEDTYEQNKDQAILSMCEMDKMSKQERLRENRYLYLKKRIADAVKQGLIPRNLLLERLGIGNNELKRWRDIGEPSVSKLGEVDSKTQFLKENDQ